MVRCARLATVTRLHSAMAKKHIAEEGDEDAEATQSSGELKRLSTLDGRNSTSNGNFVDLTGSPSPPPNASHKPIPTTSPAQLARDRPRAHSHVQSNVVSSPSYETETNHTTLAETSRVPVKAEADAPKSAIRNPPLSTASQRTSLNDVRASRHGESPASQAKQHALKHIRTLHDSRRDSHASIVRSKRQDPDESEVTPKGLKRARRHGSRMGPPVMPSDSNETNRGFRPPDEEDTAIDGVVKQRSLSQTPVSDPTRVSQVNPDHLQPSIVKREGSSDGQSDRQPQAETSPSEVSRSASTQRPRVKTESGELVCWPVRMPPYIQQLLDRSPAIEFPATNYKFSRDFLTKYIGGNPNSTRCKIGPDRRQNQIYDIADYHCWSPDWNLHVPPRRGVTAPLLVWLIGMVPPCDSTPNYRRQQRISISSYRPFVREGL